MDPKPAASPSPWDAAVSQRDPSVRVAVQSRLHMADLPNRHERRRYKAMLRRAKWPDLKTTL